MHRRSGKSVLSQPQETGWDSFIQRKLCQRNLEPVKQVGSHGGQEEKKIQLKTAHQGTHLQGIDLTSRSLKNPRKRRNLKIYQVRQSQTRTLLPHRV